MSSRIRDLNNEVSRRSVGDRREHRRFSVTVPVTLEINGDKIEGTLVDISYLGGLVRTAQDIQTGTQVTIYLPTIDHGIECEVRRKTEESMHGLIFPSPLLNWKDLIDPT